MKDSTTQFANVDQYIATFPSNVQERLAAMRSALREAMPEAEEGISYNIPVFKQPGVSIYFSGFKAHTSLAFYPTENVYEKLAKELAPYKKSKSTVQFSLSEPLPVELIKKIALFKVREAAK